MRVGVARESGARQDGGRDFPFGDFGLLGRGFVAHSRHSRLVQSQLERSSMTAEQAVRSPEHWLGLSPLTKADMLADQELDPPYGTRRRVTPAELGLVV